jgi:hypothetical protein
LEFGLYHQGLSVMKMRFFSPLGRSLCGLLLLGIAWYAPLALAYKVEKVCEDIPATNTAKAMTKCKIVAVRPVKEGEAAKEKKEEAPGGHGAPAQGEAKPKH